MERRQALALVRRGGLPRGEPQKVQPKAQELPGDSAESNRGRALRASWWAPPPTAVVCKKGAKLPQEGGRDRAALVLCYAGMGRTHGLCLHVTADIYLLEDSFSTAQGTKFNPSVCHK